MTRRWIPACFAALAALSLAAAVATGCTSNQAAPAAVGPTQCLPSLSEANGSACAEGLVCPYLFPCGQFQQETTCSCVNGFLDCVIDSTDASVPVGATPTCSPQTNPGTCPGQEPNNFTACATVGLTCLYFDLVCPGAEAGPNIDTCACGGGDDGGLVFTCAIDECTPQGGDAGVGTPFDANAPDAPSDGGDASFDSGDDSG